MSGLDAFWCLLPSSRSHILERLWAAISCQIGSIEHLQGCCCLITNRKTEVHSQGPRKTRSCPGHDSWRLYVSRDKKWPRDNLSLRRCYGDWQAAIWTWKESFEVKSITVIITIFAWWWNEREHQNFSISAKSNIKCFRYIGSALA